MKYFIVSTLIAWIFPTKEDRKQFRTLCKKIDERREIAKIQRNYQLLLKKFQQKQNFRVLFLVNENTKWKAQSLFDLMMKSSVFEPVIALTISDIQEKLPLKEKERILKNNYHFFSLKNMPVEIAYDIKSDKALDLSEFHPDIVFYQQPYKLPKRQALSRVSKFALTVYIPYYLPDYENLELDCESVFHNAVYKYYVINDELKNIFEQHLKNTNKYTSRNIVAVGHTILDNYVNNFSTANNNTNKKDYVIYAPHWSIRDKNNENNINISTFDKNGNFILNYALQHQNINWVFKPHPTLKEALSRIGWNKEKINKYYSAWESFALCCYDSNYFEIFKNSQALITDCGSFKLEYFYSGKPILNLLPDYIDHPPYSFMKPVLKSLYEIKNNDELVSCIETVILNKNDYKKEERYFLLDSLKLTDKTSAQRIYDNLMQDLKQSKGRLK